MYTLDYPSVIEECPRVVVIGDIHGDIGRLTQCLYATKVINENNEWIAEPPNTIVVQLGDQVDSASRGNTVDWERVADIEVVKFMDSLDQKAQHKGGSVFSLIGNHELMNVMGDFSYVSEKSIQMTGGEDARRKRFQPGGIIARQLSRRNVVLKIGKLCFCHGGLLPHHLEEVDNNIHRINETFRHFLRGEQLNEEESRIFRNVIVSEVGILWTRKYVEMMSAGNDMILDAFVDNVLERIDCKHIFVGHSTVNNITPMLKGKVWLMDAMLSRAYGAYGIRVLESINNGEEFKLVQSAPPPPSEDET